MLKTPLYIALLLGFSTAAARGQISKERRITVEDTIRMTVLPATTYTAGVRPGVAHFSPDGSRFVVVTARGLPETNENEFSLLLYHTSAAMHSPRPDPIVSMRSRSNRDAIKNVKWVSQDTLYFIGEADGTSQVYSLNVSTRRLAKCTDHATPVVDYDANSLEEVLVYAVEPGPPDPAKVEDKIAHGYAITLESLSDVPRSRADFLEPDQSRGEEIFVKHRGKPEVRVPLEDRYLPLTPISLSPDGQHAVFGVFVRHVSPSWIEYEDGFIRPEVQAYGRKGSIAWIMEYELLDTALAQAEPLIQGPVDTLSNGTAWSPDGKHLAVSGQFLPLDVSDPAERSARAKQAFAIAIDLGTRDFQKISARKAAVWTWTGNPDRVYFRPALMNEPVRTSFVRGASGWVEDANGPADPPDTVPVEITTEQDLNTPPRLFVKEFATGHKALLLDLNPQLAEFELGKVEVVRWQASDGHEVEGDLYLPPDYRTGVRYPLVLQTHASTKNEFWVNGPWNSGFAAQPLAARGFVVLQIGHGTEPGAYMRYHRSPSEAPREMAAYEGAIQYLDAKGLIDRARVGIIAFSRTQYHVAYTLTHSAFQFAAVILIDGFDGGYLQYLDNPYSEKDLVMVNGGPPFRTGFAKWLEHSPSFGVDRVTAPVRIECHDWGVVGCWEWYSLLTHLGKPVELIYLPDAVHILVKPWERITSQQGAVDWFCFWLKREEDAAPGKRTQYERWREMREKQATGPSSATR